MGFGGVRGLGVREFRGLGGLGFKAWSFGVLGLFMACGLGFTSWGLGCPEQLKLF